MSLAKRLAALAACLLAACTSPVLAQTTGTFVSGQTLTAAQLNTALGTKADTAGGTITGGTIANGTYTGTVTLTGSTWRTALGLGTAATQNTGTSGATIPFLNGNNTWSGRQAFQGASGGPLATFTTNGGYGTSPTNYPVIVDQTAISAVSARNAAMLQIVGTPNVTSDSEVNLVDAFAYNGAGQFDLERYNRGSLLTNGSTSTSSPTLHVTNVPQQIRAGSSFYDGGNLLGTSSGTTSAGATTVTLSANSAFPVASGDTLTWVGPNSGAVKLSESIGAYTWEPFDGVSDGNTAQILGVATEDQANDTNHGTGIYFFDTPNAQGSSTRFIALCLNPGGLGGVTVGEGASFQSCPTDPGRNNLKVAGTVSTLNHFRSQGPTPTVGTCGTGPSISGTDVAGSVTTGTGSPTACTITFATAFTAAPICQAQVKANATPTAYVLGTSTTGVVVNFSAGFTGTFTYICLGNA